MKIAYYPAGGPDFASSRLRVWNIIPELKALGHEVVVNSDALACDVLMVQKRWDIPDLMLDARKRGTRVIWDCDDWMHNGMGWLADQVTVDTAYKTALFTKAVVVPDSLDLPEDYYWKGQHRKEPDTVVWFGNAENIKHTLYVSRACQELGLTLHLITSLSTPQDYGLWQPCVRIIEWDARTINLEIMKGDIAVCPYIPDGPEDHWVYSKSENRLIKAWALGLPVIGTPIPSYVKAGLQFHAEDQRDWTGMLLALGGKALREEDARKGRMKALTYSAKHIVHKWLEVFCGKN